MLNTAIRYLKESELYEFAITLYKIVLALHEKSKALVELSIVHKSLTALYDDIIKAVIT